MLQMSKLKCLLVYKQENKLYKLWHLYKKNNQLDKQGILDINHQDQHYLDSNQLNKQYILNLMLYYNYLMLWLSNLQFLKCLLVYNQQNKLYKLWHLYKKNNQLDKCILDINHKDQHYLDSNQLNKQYILNLMLFDNYFMIQMSKLKFLKCLLVYRSQNKYKLYKLRELYKKNNQLDKQGILDINHQDQYYLDSNQLNKQYILSLILYYNYLK